jgi:hypothetical protein
MEWKEIKQKIIEKAEFYQSNEIKAHVLTVPKGTFRNGLFVSKVQDDKYFWFIELNSSIPIRLFLAEIYDIEDYREVEE